MPSVYDQTCRRAKEDPQAFWAAAGEVYWAGSDIGWVVGHSCIVYGPLLRGATAILDEITAAPRGLGYPREARSVNLQRS